MVSTILSRQLILFILVAAIFGNPVSAARGGMHPAVIARPQSGRSNLDKMTSGFALTITSDATPSTTKREDSHLVATEWMMINVNASVQQADAHLIRFKDGKTFLIDVGDSGTYLIPFLKKKNVQVVDKVLITHAHRDHYQGLRDLLNSGIQVRELYMNAIDRGVCDLEKPWGCDYEHVTNFMTEMRNRALPAREIHAGDFLYQGKTESLKVLYAFNGVQTPVGATDVNDTSVITLLTSGKTRALLTGDLNEKLGTYLSKQANDIKADILKAPHHGTTKCASNDFFNRVAPLAVLVPSPKALWLSERSRPIRDYFTMRRIPAYVNGIHGTVTVVMDNEGFRITSETGKRSNEY